MSRQYKNQIGPQVRKRRYALGWSQSAFAAKLQISGLDITRSEVAKIEARIRGVHDVELIFLANVLKVTTDDLMPKPDPKKPLHEFMQHLETKRI